MRQVCNVVYHVLTDGKTKAQIAEVDVALSDPKDREMMLAKQNEQAMRELQAMGGFGFIPPPPRPAEKKS